jgi:hypothetical protein
MRKGGREAVRRLVFVPFLGLFLAARLLPAKAVHKAKKRGKR